MSPACILNIGGIDPSSGAGITADIKTCELSGIYGLTAATAITSQNHDSFYNVKWLNADEIISQLTPLFGHYNIRSIKIGLIENQDTLIKVANVLKENLPQIPLIWDPILTSSSGFKFHESINTKQLQDIISRFTVITPNRDEAMQIFPELATKSVEEFSQNKLSLLIKS